MKEVINLISDDEEELPSGPSAGTDSIHCVSALATTQNSPSPTPFKRESPTAGIKVSATPPLSTCDLLKIPSGTSAGFKSCPAPSTFPQSATTIEKDLNHHTGTTPTPESPPRVRTQRELLLATAEIMLRIDDTPSDTPPQASRNELGSFFHRLRCTAGSFEFCNDDQYWNIRLSSLVPFGGSPPSNSPTPQKSKSKLKKSAGIRKAKERLHNEVELFTDLCKATIKLEFFVDFPKPIKGKYSTTKVPFIPTSLIQRVIPEEAQKSFWNALNSRKKENRRQVLTRSAADLVSLLKVMKFWPHPESSDSDRQQLYRQAAQSRTVMIHFLSDIADAVDIKQIYTPEIVGNELAKEWAGFIMHIILEKKWREEQWERLKKWEAREALIKLEISRGLLFEKKETVRRKLREIFAIILDFEGDLTKRWTEFVRNEWNENFFASWGSRARLALADVPVNDITFGMPTRPSRGISLQAICEAQGSSLDRYNIDVSKYLQRNR